MLSVCSGADIRIDLDGSTFGAVQGIDCVETADEGVYGTLIAIADIGDHPDLGKTYRMKVHGANEYGHTYTFYEGDVVFEYRNWGVGVDDIIVEVQYFWYEVNSD